MLLLRLSLQFEQVPDGYNRGKGEVFEIPEQVIFLRG